MLCCKIIKSPNNLKLKVRTEFPNVWGEYKYHSNPYIQGTTVPCDIIASVQADCIILASAPYGHAQILNILYYTANAAVKMKAACVQRLAHLLTCLMIVPLCLLPAQGAPEGGETDDVDGELST